jgi:hypothetical protein
VYQPYEGLIPYHEFSVRLPKSRLQHIADILKAIPDEQYKALRMGMRKYWPAFIWHPGYGGLAYNYTISSLQQRLNDMLGHQF